MESLTLKDIDELISNLGFEEASGEFVLLKTIRSFYTKDEDLANIKSNKAEKVIQLLWPAQDTTPKALKAYIKNKRKDLSSIKASINNKCRDCFWDNRNPQRIGLDRYNTFKALKQTKYEETKRFQTEIQYLRTVLQEIAPEELRRIIGDSPKETQVKIIKALTEKKEQAEAFDEDIILQDDMRLLEKDTKDLTRKHVESSKIVADALKINTRLVERLEEMSKKVSETQKDLEAGKITDDEGYEHLSKINEELIEISQGLKEGGQNLGALLKGVWREILNSEPEKFSELLNQFADSEEDAEIEDMVEIEGSFYIDRCPVTIEKFQKFIEKTGYETYAERKGHAWVYHKAGWIGTDNKGMKKMVFQSSALSKRKGACWNNPEGRIKNAMDVLTTINHPVVQITYFDALEYAKWAEKRLPTPEEWLLAAFGRSGDQYPWGNGPDTDKCNHKKSDFQSSSPVDIFEPNKYGVYDLIGNTWEWCENNDPDYKIVLGGCWNMEIEELGLSAKQRLNPLEYNNTIGFRCAKDK